MFNDFAARTGDILIVYCGAARTSDGHIVVLSGVPEAGKSALTATLVAAGCDYVGDEITGLRPDTLVAVEAPDRPRSA